MRGVNLGTRAALRAVPACAALGTLLSGCGLFYPAPQPPGPPRTLSSEELIGTWRDEAHGRLAFSADGSFTATDVCGDYMKSGDDIVGVEEPLTMTGTGAWDPLTWDPERADGRPVTTVRVEFSEWFADYDVGGAAESPKLWAYKSLDNLEFCILSKQP
ncbi:hypothetical protein ACWC9U_05505 [Streptomyces sp. 900116325]